MWTELGHAQLDGGAVNEAISSYLRSGDSSRYRDVIARSQEANAHGDLVKYLLMVRKKVKESKVRHSRTPVNYLLMVGKKVKESKVSCGRNTQPRAAAIVLAARLLRR